MLVDVSASPLSARFFRLSDTCNFSGFTSIELNKSLDKVCFCSLPVNFHCFDFFLRLPLGLFQAVGLSFQLTGDFAVSLIFICFCLLKENHSPTNKDPLCVMRSGSPSQPMSIYLLCVSYLFVWCDALVLFSYHHFCIIVLPSYYSIGNIDLFSFLITQNLIWRLFCLTVSLFGVYRFRTFFPSKSKYRRISVSFASKRGGVRWKASTSGCARESEPNPR